MIHGYRYIGEILRTEIILQNPQGGNELWKLAALDDRHEKMMEVNGGTFYFSRMAMGGEVWFAKL